MIGVYKIVNVVNGKFYIGSLVDIENRWKSHIHELNLNQHNNSHLQNAWNKYGAENFRLEVVEITDINTVRERETFYLKNTNCTNADIGYNILDNANIGLGVKSSDEVRKKLSNSCRGEKNGHYGKCHSNETKERISKIKREKGAEIRQARLQQWISEQPICEVCKKIMTVKYGSGRFCSTECKNAYMSIIQKSKPHAAEHNKKVSEALKGKKFSTEHKAKISELAKNRMSTPENNPMYGKHHSDETKAHWSEVRKGKHYGTGFTGKHHSDETKQKISQSLKRKKGV